MVNILLRGSSSYSSSYSYSGVWTADDEYEYDDEHDPHPPAVAGCPSGHERLRCRQIEGDIVAFFRGQVKNLAHQVRTPSLTRPLAATSAEGRWDADKRGYGTDWPNEFRAATNFGVRRP